MPHQCRRFNPCLFGPLSKRTLPEPRAGKAYLRRQHCLSRFSLVLLLIDDSIVLFHTFITPDRFCFASFFLCSIYWRSITIASGVGITHFVDQAFGWCLSVAVPPCVRWVLPKLSFLAICTTPIDSSVWAFSRILTLAHLQGMMDRGLPCATRASCVWGLVLS